MFKPWKLVVFFLLCLVFALVVNLPVQHVLSYVQLPKTVSLDGIDGTVTSGRAQEIRVNEFPLRSVNYRFLPSCLLLFKVCYKIRYEQGDLQVAYDVLNGDTEVSEAKVEYPVSELAQFMPKLPVNPVGGMELMIDELSLVEGRAGSLSGKLIWRNLGVNDPDVKIDIGDYQVDFFGNQQKYDFKFSDLDATLDVDGKGEIKADGQYNVDVKIKSDASLDANVKTVLSLVAKNVKYNEYRVEQKGRLPASTLKQIFR